MSVCRPTVVCLLDNYILIVTSETDHRLHFTFHIYRPCGGLFVIRWRRGSAMVGFTSVSAQVKPNGSRLIPVNEFRPCRSGCDFEWECRSFIYTWVWSGIPGVTPGHLVHPQSCWLKLRGGGWGFVETVFHNTRCQMIHDWCKSSHLFMSLRLPVLVLKQGGGGHFGFSPSP